MDNYKILLQHPTGNANVRALANAMVKEGVLDCFHTSIAVFEKHPLYKLTQWSLFKEFKRRTFHDSLYPFTISHPKNELIRLLSLKLKWDRMIAHEVGPYSIDNIYHKLDAVVANSINNNKCIQAVYAYEDAALYSFQAAQSRGLDCLYDLPIGYWKAARVLLAEEKKRRPEWFNTIVGFKDSDIKLKRKDDEIKFANRIFVASSFTASTLNYYDGDLPQIDIIPYGFPIPIQHRDYDYQGQRPLKLLFVGGLSQRKGIADLLEVVEALKGYVELTIVGRKGAVENEILNQALKKYTWIPSLEHSKVLELMQKHDVLVFPSLFEGFGLVITEAMSRGIPVITTNRTAGPDIITNNKNGWIVTAGAPTELKSAIENILQHPDQLIQVSKNALDTAKLRTWENYGVELVESICNPPRN